MRILLVEDDPRLQQSLKLLLERLGHSVLACNDASEAIRAFDDNEESFGAVITDTRLPVGSGIHVLDQAWLSGLKIPCLLHSADDFYSGRDLRKIHERYPSAVFRSKSGNIPAYIKAFLDNPPRA